MPDESNLPSPPPAPPTAPKIAENQPKIPATPPKKKPTEKSKDQVGFEKRLSILEDKTSTLESTVKGVLDFLPGLKAEPARKGGGFFEEIL